MNLFTKNQAAFGGKPRNDEGAGLRAGRPLPAVLGPPHHVGEPLAGSCVSVRPSLPRRETTMPAEEHLSEVCLPARRRPLPAPEGSRAGARRFDDEKVVSGAASRQVVEKRSDHRSPS
jgi:hypothetical protein